jgi:hypothetical protein
MRRGGNSSRIPTASSANHVRWIREEAAMAQIILDTGHQEETIRSRFGARFASLREMLDAFVSYRMRVAAAEAEHVRSRQTPNAQLLSTNVR